METINSFVNLCFLLWMNEIKDDLQWLFLKKKTPLNWNATITAVVCYSIVILVIWESQTVNTVCRYSLEQGLRGDVLVHWYTARSLTHILYWSQDKQEIMMFLSLGKMSWADCVTMALARLAWVKVIFVGDLLFFSTSLLLLQFFFLSASVYSAVIKLLPTVCLFVNGAPGKDSSKAQNGLW